MILAPNNFIWPRAIRKGWSGIFGGESRGVEKNLKDKGFIYTRILGVFNIQKRQKRKTTSTANTKVTIVDVEVWNELISKCSTFYQSSFHLNLVRCYKVRLNHVQLTSAL